jgi:hypothetical protein
VGAGTETAEGGELDLDWEAIEAVFAELDMEAVDENAVDEEGDHCECPLCVVSHLS